MSAPPPSLESVYRVVVSGLRLLGQDRAPDDLEREREILYGAAPRVAIKCEEILPPHAHQFVPLLNMTDKDLDEAISATGGFIDGNAEKAQVRPLEDSLRELPRNGSTVDPWEPVR